MVNITGSIYWSNGEHQWFYIMDIVTCFFILLSYLGILSLMVGLKPPPHVLKIQAMFIIYWICLSCHILYYTCVMFSYLWYYIYTPEYVYTHLSVCVFMMIWIILNNHHTHISPLNLVGFYGWMDGWMEIIHKFSDRVYKGRSQMIGIWKLFLLKKQSYSIVEPVKQPYL